MDGENLWLERRLKELNKTKKDFALYLGIQQSHVSAILSGIRKIQSTEIKKVAEFLDFDRTAFLDFVSGDITEEELWKTKKPIKVTEEDLALLKAVKSIAARPQTTEEVANPSQSPELPKKERER